MKLMSVGFALVSCAVPGAFVLASTNESLAPVEGNYLEVRSCDVYTGSCFANGEMGLTGEEAILSWNVTRGAWKGVDVGGLGVIAVVKAQATLGYTEESPYPTKSVLIVDTRADASQRRALADMADELGGALVEAVVAIEEAPIETSFGACGKTVCAEVRAGDLVHLAARCLGDGDHICGNEEAFYPPLARVEHAMPHLALRDRFAGEGLGVTWDDSGRRSAYVATFAAHGGG